MAKGMIKQVMRRAEATYEMMRALEICSSEREAYELCQQSLKLWISSKQRGKTLDEAIDDLKQAEREVLEEL